MKKIVLLFAAFIFAAVTANTYAQSKGEAPAPGATHTYSITPGDSNNEIQWTVYNADFSTEASLATVSAPTSASTTITWASSVTPDDWYYVQVVETDTEGCSNTKVLPVQITEPKLSRDEFKSRLEFNSDIVGTPKAPQIEATAFASTTPSPFGWGYADKQMGPSTASIQAPERADTGIQPLSLLDLSDFNAPTLGPVDPNLTAPQAPTVPTVQAPQVAPVAPQPITAPVMSLPRAQPGAPGSILPLGARPGPVNPAAIKTAQRMTRGLTTGVGGLLGGPLGALAGNLIGRRIDDRAGRAASDFLSGGLVGASGHTYASGTNIGNGLSAWNRSGNAGDFWDYNSDTDNIAQQAWDRERAASGQTNRMSLGDVLSRDFGGMFSSSDRKSGGSGSGGVSWW